MPRRRTTTRQCRSRGGKPKRQYASEADALDEAGPGVGAYPCELCYCWHRFTLRAGGSSRARARRARLRARAIQARRLGWPGARSG